jgi:hypothetical protein
MFDLGSCGVHSDAGNDSFDYGYGDWPLKRSHPVWWTSMPSAGQTWTTNGL